jgi:hypothetical protein
MRFVSRSHTPTGTPRVYGTRVPPQVKFLEEDVAALLRASSSPAYVDALAAAAQVRMTFSAKLAQAW